MRFVPRRIRFSPANIGVALCLAAAALLVIREAVVRHVATRQPELALALKSNDVPALVAAGNAVLMRPDDPKVQAAALGWTTDLLVASPLDSRALRLAAGVALARRDAAGADRLMLLAGRRSQRDDIVQGWLFDLAVSRRRFAAAAYHADAMLRHRPELGATMFPVLSEGATRPAMARAVARRLATSPPWRSALFAGAERRSIHLSGVVALIDRLADTRAPAGAEEIAPVVTRLAAQGDPTGAHALWRRHAPERSQKLLAGLDGAATTGLSIPAAARGQVVARALLARPAGQYLFSSAIAPAGAGSRFRWRLGCTDRRRAVPELALDGDARDVTFPAAGCALQWLTLVAVRESPRPLFVPLATLTRGRQPGA